MNLGKTLFAQTMEFVPWTKFYTNCGTLWWRFQRACRLYCIDSWGVDLANTAYALNATTIDLCLSLFPLAPFRSTKAAVKMYTPLDLLGNSCIHPAQCGRAAPVSRW